MHIIFEAHGAQQFWGCPGSDGTQLAGGLQRESHWLQMANGQMKAPSPQQWLLPVTRSQGLDIPSDPHAAIIQHPARFVS